jgi:hypothetical protein
MVNNNISIDLCNASFKLNNDQVVFDDSVVKVKKINGLGQIYNIDTLVQTVYSNETKALTQNGPLLLQGLATIPGVNQSNILMAVTKITDSQITINSLILQSITIKQFMTNYITHWFTIVYDLISSLVICGLAPLNETLTVLNGLALQDVTGPFAPVLKAINYLNNVKEAFERRDSVSVNSNLDQLLLEFNGIVQLTIQNLVVALKLSKETATFIGNALNLYSPYVLNNVNAIKEVAKQP